MVFKTIEDDATRSGLRITSIFHQVFDAIKSSGNFSLGTTFTTSLQNDIVCIENFKAAVAAGVAPVEALNNCMYTASQAAIQYAQSMDASELSTNEFVIASTKVQIATMAQNRSWTNCKSLITAYNNSMSMTGLTQQQFIDSVRQSNSGLAQYLAGLNGANATFRGYIGSLITAKAATIGLQVATTALNAVIGMGIGLLISLVTSLLSAGWEKIQEALKSTDEKLNDLGETAKEIKSTINGLASSFRNLKSEATSVIPKFAELADGVDKFGKNVSLTDEEYAEFLSLNNQIAEMFPELNMGMDSNGNAMLSLSYSADTLADSLWRLVEAEREAANVEIAKKMPDLVSTLSQQQDAYDEKIDELEAQRDNALSDIKAERKWARAIKTEQDTAYRKMLEKYGIEYESSTYISSRGTGVKFTIADIDAAKEQIREYTEKQIQAIENEAAAEWSELNSVANAWMQTNALYGSMDSSMQNIAQYMVGGIDFSSINIDSAEDVENYVYDNIISPLFHAAPDVQEAFAEITNLQEQLDAGEIDTTTFETKVRTAFNNLKNGLDEDVANTFSTLFINGFNNIGIEGADFDSVVSSYIDALTGKDIADIPNVKISFGELMADENFNETVDAYIEKVESLQDALKSIQDEEFNNSNFIELVKQFPELADNADDLDSAIIQLINDLTGGEDEFGNFTGIYKTFKDEFEKLKTDEDRAALQNFMDSVISLGEVVGNTSFSIDIAAETEGIQAVLTAMKESVSSTGLTAESIKELKARYQELEGYDAARLFERTANGIHLNTKALRELESAYEQQRKQEINNDLQELVDQYNELTRGISGTSDAAVRADLYAQRADILDQINDTADLAAQYEGLTSAFYKWEQAQSIGEEGDMYDSLAGSLENIKELYQEGLIGTNKFRTAVQLMSNEDLSTASIDELLAAYDTGYAKMTRYFTDSSDGCLNFLNDVQDLNSEWARMNSDGSWEINFGVGNDQEIADALNINVESVQAIMRKLSDYGFDINLDSMYTSLDLLMSSAEKANEKLIELGKTDIKFNFDTTDLNVINSQITDAQALLDTFKDSDGTVNLKTEGAAEASEILITLISYKQQLNAPSIMSVDTSQAETDISNVIGLLQNYQTNYNDLQISTAVGADTSEAQTNIQTVLNQLNTMPDDVKTKLGLDDADFQTALATLTATEVDVEAGVNLDTTALDTVVGYISSITPEMMVEAGLDASQIDGYVPPEKDGEVTYTVDDSAVQKWTAPNKKGSVTYYARINSWTVPTRYGTVIYTAKINGSARAAGTAYATGTIGKAFKQGSWGAKETGLALGGELGQELVVRDGRFFTIGDDSAEFFNYKKGDIIFNAEQTKQIFSKGKISSGAKRGTALANGTAHAEGRAFSSGNGSIIVDGNVQTSSTGDGSSSSNSEKEFKETFDWIEIAIDRIERAIARLDLKSSSVYKSWGNRNATLKDQISEIEDEIALQASGYDRYIQQANSVGLSEDWAAKVRDGKVDISTITDEGLAEQIKEYQEWYLFMPLYLVTGGGILFNC